MGSEELQPTFEVYPSAASGTASEPAPGPGWEPDPAGPLWEQPGPELPGERVPVPARPGPPVPAEPVGPDRRTVFRIGIGVVLAAVFIGGIAQFEYQPPEYEAGWVQEDVTYADEIDLGVYFAPVPQGWELRATSAAEAVVTNGANRLEAYAFNAADGDRAADLVKELSRLRRGGFSGQLGQVSDTSDGDVQRATVRATGTVAGSPARLVGQLWIGADARALLVVRVLTAPKGSSIDGEALGMAQELSWDYGGAE